MTPPLPRNVLAGAAAVTVAALAFNVIVHTDVIVSRWTKVGPATGALVPLGVDTACAIVWLFVILTLVAAFRYRGDLRLLILPMVLSLVGRALLFPVATDPAWASARGEERGRAIAAKITRTRLDALLQQPVSNVPAPEVAAATEVRRLVDVHTMSDPSGFTGRRLLSYAPVLLAPVALLIGFIATRRGLLLYARRGRWLLLVGGLLVALGGRIIGLRGPLAGFTPLELALPVLAISFAAIIDTHVVELRRPNGRTAITVGPALAGVATAASAFIALPGTGSRSAAEFGVLGVLLSAFGAAAFAQLLDRRLLSTVVLCFTAVACFAMAASERPRDRFLNAYNPYPTVDGMDSAQRAIVARRNAQVRQSDGAIIAGGLLGAGAGGGGAEWVPRAGDDLIFTTTAAQWGIVGTASVIALYVVLLCALTSASLGQANSYYRGVAGALMALIATPCYLAFLGATRGLPLTGVTPAFVGQGGSKLLAAAFSIGVVAALSHKNEAYPMPCGSNPDRGRS